MKIVFRVDSSIHIGLGHLMRCIVLANEYRKGGHDIFFICRELEGNFIPIINFPVIKLPRNSENKISIEHINNIKINQEIDAEQTACSIPPKTDILIIDNYGFDEVWHKKLRNHTKKIVVIDDLADRNFECDILINQNYGVKNIDYQNIISKECRLLLGLEYALLRPEFKKLRANSIERRREVVEVKNILITSGGSDIKNITLGILRQLDDSFNIAVILGTNSPHNQEVKLFAHNKDNINVFINPKNTAELMLNADLCIGSSGSTNWERLCMGLPSIVFTVAENQTKVTKMLDKNGLVKHIGFINDNASIPLIREEIQNISSLPEWAKKCFNSCNCSGVEKVVEITEKLMD